MGALVVEGKGSGALTADRQTWAPLSWDGGTAVGGAKARIQTDELRRMPATAVFYHSSSNQLRSNQPRHTLALLIDDSNLVRAPSLLGYGQHSVSQRHFTHASTISCLLVASEL